MLNPASKRENPFINIIFSVALPAIILSKLSGADALGPVKAVIFALSFPLGYALYFFIRTRKASFITVLGFLSILLKGVFVIYQVPLEWFAIKEAAIPLLIGVVILVSMNTKSPIVEEMLYNENVINVKLVSEKLETTEHKTQFERLLRSSSIILSVSFLVSAILGYTLAHMVLKAEPGTSLFNEQLGRMQALHWPIIVLPSTIVLFFALWRLLKGLEKLTGLPQDQILNTQQK